MQLRSVGITDGRPRKVNFVTDMFGQVIWRGEKDNVTTAGDPHEMWFRFSGRQIGYVGNNGTQDVDYATSVAYRVATQGTNAFFNGQHSAPLHADWDLAYDSTNTYTQGSTRGMYVVQAGDTLSGIAAALWGDASLWWKLAEVNGLTAESTLPEGLPLIIPAGVIVHHNTALTYQPYDPLEVLGNTSPTAPKPAFNKKGPCGVFGMVLLTIMVAYVAWFAAPYAVGAVSALSNGATLGAANAAGLAAMSTATGAAAGGGAAGVAAGVGAGIGSGAATITATGAIVGGAVTGAGASILYQGLAVATGIQEKFSWSAVAMAAISGGVGGGLGHFASNADGVTRAVLNNSFANGAISNALTQGIGMAVGAQKKFSWAAVASAGLGSTIGTHVTNPLLKNGAALLADVGARTLIEGTDFGDNVLAALPNVIAQTMVDVSAGRLQKTRAERDWEDHVGGADKGNVAETTSGTMSMKKPFADFGNKQYSGERWETYMNSRNAQPSESTDDADNRTLGERLIEEGRAELERARDAERERDPGDAEIGSLGGLAVTDRIMNGLQQLSGVVKLQMGLAMRGAEITHDITNVLSVGGAFKTGVGVVTVFRVEGAANARLLIGPNGAVSILERERTLFLNFGSYMRAEAFLTQKLGQGYPAALRSFQVPESFLAELRAAAVPERLARSFPDRPIVVDVTRASDQFGLRPQQIRRLEEEIIQGSGR